MSRRTNRRSRTPRRRVCRLLIPVVHSLRFACRRCAHPPLVPPFTPPRTQNLLKHHALNSRTTEHPASGQGMFSGYVPLPLAPFARQSVSLRSVTCSGWLRSPSLRPFRFATGGFIQADSFSARTSLRNCHATPSLRAVPPLRSIHSPPVCTTRRSRFHFAVAKDRLKHPPPLQKLGNRASPISASTTTARASCGAWTVKHEHQTQVLQFARHAAKNATTPSPNRQRHRTPRDRTGNVCVPCFGRGTGRQDQPPFCSHRTLTNAAPFASSTPPCEVRDRNNPHSPC
jgi:hypothetical protein